MSALFIVTTLILSVLGIKYGPQPLNTIAFLLLMGQVVVLLVAASEWAIKRSLHDIGRKLRGE